jgi:hypothetical protein
MRKPLVASVLRPVSGVNESVSKYFGVTTVNYSDYVALKRVDPKEKLVKLIEAELVKLNKCFFMIKGFTKSLVEKYNGLGIRDLECEAYDKYLDSWCCGNEYFPCHVMASEVIDKFKLKMSK